MTIRATVETCYKELEILLPLQTGEEQKKMTHLIAQSIRHFFFLFSFTVVITHDFVCVIHVEC